MALALNVFKTITKVVSTTPTKVYTAPVGYTGVALFCNIVNSGATTHDVSISHQRTVSGVEVTTPIHIQRPVPSKDSFKPFYGKFGCGGAPLPAMLLYPTQRRSQTDESCSPSAGARHRPDTFDEYSQHRHRQLAPRNRPDRSVRLSAFGPEVY
jgi:hypothetical protein